MTLNFAQVFGENYDPEVNPYPLISIMIESGYDTDWEQFDIGEEQLLLDRMNEMIKNADEVFEYEDIEEGYIKACIEWSAEDYDILYEWEFNRKEWEEKLSKDMDEIVEAKDKKTQKELFFSDSDSDDEEMEVRRKAKLPKCEKCGNPRELYTNCVDCENESIIQGIASMPELFPSDDDDDDDESDDEFEGIDFTKTNKIIAELKGCELALKELD